MRHSSPGVMNVGGVGSYSCVVLCIPQSVGGAEEVAHSYALRKGVLCRCGDHDARLLVHCHLPHDGDAGFNEGESFGGGLVQWVQGR